MASSKVNSVILVPTYRYLEPETLNSLGALSREGWNVVIRHGCSAIDQARAIMATDAFLKGFDWLYWIDSDMAFGTYHFDRLVQWDEPLCCAPYAIKSSGGMIAVRPANFDSETRGKVEIEAAGFGFMKTHRSIYDRMTSELPVCSQDSRGDKPLIPFFQPRWWSEPDGRTVYLGEDYSFCLHAKQLGFKLLADFDLDVGHIGRWDFRIRDPL